MPYQFKKHLGQHFLRDRIILESMIEQIDVKSSDTIIEIGPGDGALTSYLLELALAVHAVELDNDLIGILKKKFSVYGSKLVVHTGDAVKFDFGLFKHLSPLRIVGNLPYNITGPVIIHLFSFHKIIKDLHFLLQKEVVDRLIAIPGNKDYGRLSVMTQTFFNVDAMFEVPPESFKPQPKIQSQYVRLYPIKENINKLKNFELLSEIVRLAFQQRRKKVVNALKTIVPDDSFMKAKIPLHVRPGDLSVSDYINLSNTVFENNN